MQAWRLAFARALASLLLAASVTSPVLAHGGIGQDKGKRHPSGENAGRQPRAGNKQDPGVRAMAGLPPKWMERLREMSPQEQERFLANNERFQQLPPERRDQIRKRLQQWNTLTPEQRADVRRREEVWRQMSPEQKRYIREVLLPRWQQLPPDRRQAILQRLRALNGLNEAQRGAKLNDPAFLQGLKPDEQTMLRELSNLRTGIPPELPQENP